jgi:hypothetical protein
MKMDKIGKLNFNRANSYFLGSGRYRNVFPGKYSGATDVAVKRFDKGKTSIDSSHYLKTKGHSNVTLYYCTKETDIVFKSPIN